MGGKIGAVVLAAGQSKRMGQPKLVLPWGKRTVIEVVVGTLLEAGAAEVIVVTGGAREEIEAALRDSTAQTIYNPAYQLSEMLVSLQAGVKALADDIGAMLVALGDQPSVPVEAVRAVVEAYKASRARLVIPSYQMRRGHPWLVDRALWTDLLAMTPEQTMRDFLYGHEEEIQYVIVDSPGVLKDMDTPEDYDQLRTGNNI